MNNKLKFSFVIPAYNIEHYINKCIDSIICQIDSIDNKFDIEVIIINDGSTDNTSRLIHNCYANKSFIKIVDQVNQGLSVSRNNGLKIASGDYVWFVDGDDCIADNSLLDLFEFCSNCLSEIIVFNANSFNQNQTNVFFDMKITENLVNKNPKDILKKLLVDDYSFGWCVWHYLFKREFLIRDKIYFDVGRISEDIGFTFDAFLYSKSISCFKSDSIYLYRISNFSSITHQAKFAFPIDILYYISRNLPKLDELKDKELCDLIKLNYQTLIEVILFWYSTYNLEEKKILLKELEKINLIYKIEHINKKRIKRKEKWSYLFIKIFGFDILGGFWGIKRSLYKGLKKERYHEGV